MYVSFENEAAVFDLPVNEESSTGETTVTPIVGLDSTLNGDSLAIGQKFTVEDICSFVIASAYIRDTSIPYFHLCRVSISWGQLRSAGSHLDYSGCSLANSCPRGADHHLPQ